MLFFTTKLNKIPSSSHGGVRFKIKGPGQGSLDPLAATCNWLAIKVFVVLSVALDVSGRVGSVLYLTGVDCRLVGQDPLLLR